ncbi:MAG: two-component system alkaline phosphatase synthesis response regulator PhoP [Verrucomicrobiales bacterium]|jgi:two-component system alkaline phosphatase synthesis response regulator PhoP
MNTPAEKILVVDDEKSFTDLMRMNLIDEGYVVEVENDSSKAIEKAHEFEPDLILLDIVMPGPDGSDVLRQIRSEEKMSSTPVVLISALVSNEEAKGDAGIHTPDGLVMAKPVRFDKLLECIRGLLAPAH